MATKSDVKVSTLNKTWIIDLDGTILKHNGYKDDGVDTLLDSGKNILSKIKDNDMVIIITSRKKEYANITEKFLNECGIKYDYIIYEAPYGERILVNDRKPSGLNMALAININRNQNIEFEINEDESL